MALGLQGDRPSLELDHSISDQRLGICVARIELRSLVLQDDLAIDDMSDDFVAEDFEFRRDPLVAVVGFRFRVGAVGFEELTVHFDVGAWSAQVERRSGIFAVAT